MSTNIISFKAPASQVIPLKSESLSDFPIPVIENILSFLSFQSEWYTCCLTSKKIKTINEKLHPLGKLVTAIRTRKAEVIKNLLAGGISVHFRIRGTKYCPNVHYTPLICAQEYRLPNKVINQIKKHDNGFTEQFLKNKLLSLTYDINPRYSVNGCSFTGSGLDHLSHHHHLLPELISSLKSFFNEFDESANWDLSKTQSLLKALEKYPCLSCSQERTSREVIKKMRSGELVISSKSVHGHEHWVTYAAMGEFIAIGNRGLGCGTKSGVVVYKITKEFSFKDIDFLFHANGNPSPRHATFFCYLEQEKQKTGSCSKYSLDAGSLAGIFLLLNEQNELGSYDHSIGEESKNIIKKFSHYELVNKTKAIIQNGNLEGYDFFVLAEVWTNVELCPETKESLWCLLDKTIRQTDWEEKDIPRIENLLLQRCKLLIAKGESEKLEEVAELLPQFSSDFVFDIKKTATQVISKFSVNRDSFLLEASNSMYQKGNLNTSCELIDMVEANTVEKTHLRKLIIKKCSELGQIDRALEQANKVPNGTPVVKQTVYAGIAFECVLQNNEEKAFEILSLIKEIQPATYELIVFNLAKDLWAQGKSDLCWTLTKKIQSYWQILGLLDFFLKNARHAAEETVVANLIIGRFQRGWGREKRSLAFETQIAETLINKGHFAQALSLIEFICNSSISSSSTLIKKDNLEKAIALIKLDQYLVDKKETTPLLQAAGWVAKGNFFEARYVSQNLSGIPKDWILDKGYSELKSLINQNLTHNYF